MRNLFKVIGFIIKWGGSLTVIYINHIVLVDTGKELDWVGLLVAVGIIISFVHWVDGRVKVWDIQDKNKIFRLSWNNGKSILVAIILTWTLYTVENNLPKLQWTATLITGCFIIGFVFTLLGNIKKKVTQNE